MVIIMAAGRGSRMKNKDSSKCSMILNSETKECSVSRLINQMVGLGQRKFVVVLGYCAEGLAKVIEESSNAKAEITYVYNAYWSTLGSGKSLSVCSTLIDPNEDLYLFEGDTVISKSNLKGLVDYQRNCVLVRSQDFLSTKSVAVLSQYLVSAFIYDTNHRTDFTNLYSLNFSVHDSMQVWKIYKNSTSQFKGILQEFEKTSRRSMTPWETNLDPINRFIVKGGEMVPFVSSEPSKLINLNTFEDYQEAKELIEKGLI